jgi:4-amino-4-deoxy-L-arabinose transferase-like glycosyltransferase
MKKKLSMLLPFIIAGSVLLMLGALHWGWLNSFFFGAERAQVQAIDYFAVPKSYLNLLEGRSIYDTWGGAMFGPYATWYLAHPAFSVFVASWFSFFAPWTGYWLFVMFTIILLALSGYIISKLTPDAFNKRLAYAVMLCTFPTFWLLYVGNMHAPLILALTLILASLVEFAYSEKLKRAKTLLFAGLLVSLFSKPVVLLMLPLFLLLKETRFTTVKALLIYAFVSLLFIVVPVLNPQGIGWNRIMELAFDPAFVKEHMNIYKNGLFVNGYMKDNSIHWLNLIAQSDYELKHLDVFSLPVFIDSMLAKDLPAVIYKLPIYISILLSVGVACIADRKLRMESALLLVMAISLTFFLSYNTVWEYQFTSVLPVIALLPVLKERNVFYSKYVKAMFFTGIVICLPSLYFLVRHGDFQSTASVTLIRLDRIIPVFVLFVIMVVQLIVVVRKHAVWSSLKKISFSPERFFFE